MIHSSFPCSLFSLYPPEAFTSGIPYTPSPCSYFPRPSSGTSSLVAKLHSLYELHFCVQVPYIHYPTTCLCMSSSDNTAKIPISLSNYSLFILSSWLPCGYLAPLSVPPCSICQNWSLICSTTRFNSILYLTHCFLKYKYLSSNCPFLSTGLGSFPALEPHIK